MQLAYVSSELQPFSKTGGLADVAQALPSALLAHGIKPVVYTPYHRSVRHWCEQHTTQPALLKLEQGRDISNATQPLQYRTLTHDGVSIVFVCHDAYFDRVHPYLDEAGADYTDNLERYAFFCQAVLEHMLATGSQPDTIHANDWQTALLPVYLNTSYRDRFPNTASVFTIHNLGYQGLFAKEQLPLLGLGWELFTPERLEFYDQLNLLKGGVVFADTVTTVSPQYAKEIQTAEHGHGLEGVMQAARGKLSGIINGIETATWNPATDPHLAGHYSPEKLAGKKICKQLLQRELGLPVRPRSFLMGSISRFDRQKGIELIMEAFRNIAQLDVQLVLLGSGAAEYEQAVIELAATYPGQVAVQVGYNEPLAHRIEAGADAFLMPSAYEPCGLNQLYSQRYGTVPIVREVGGLKDTVINYTPRRLVLNTVSGFSFRSFDAAKLATTIRKAAKLYFTDRKAWNRLVQLIMKIDNSWSHSASQYLELYQELLDQREVINE